MKNEIRNKLISIIRESINRIILEGNNYCEYFENYSNLPDYNDILNNVEPRVFNDSYGVVEYMSGREYFIKCSKMQNPEMGEEDGYKYQVSLVRIPNKEKIK